jgi:hypothetical protein
MMKNKDSALKNGHVKSSGDAATKESGQVMQLSTMTRGVAVARETQRVREYLCVNGLYDKILV